MAFAMSEANTRKIIHVDMDAFYASVEQRDDPSLRGRPVAVGYAAKRGVVAAASYEARTFGVRSAMPSSTALRKCPDLVFVPPRFEVYRAVSHQIRSIFADYTALIEPLSLDEAYLDVTENLRGIPTASATAAEIRARIFDERVATKPGCRQLAVTPVPSRRRASSRVNKMLQSLERLYALVALNPCFDCKSSKSSVAR